MDEKQQEMLREPFPPEQVGQLVKPGVLEMEWNGRRYRRHPDSENRNHRVYWQSAAGPRTYLHRDVYEYHFGPIPKGWHVHHVNHDPLDNRPENLMAVLAAVHVSEHQREREPRRYVCDECGHDFVSRKTGNVRWCSPACKERRRRRDGLAYVRPRKGPFAERRVCEECASSYIAKRPWARFCSPACKQRAGRKARSAA